MSKYTDRKEVSQITEMSVDAVRRNEAKLGLADCKVPVNARNIRYRRKCALSALRERGFDV